MVSIDSITLEVSDPAAAERFYSDAFGLGSRVRVRASGTPTTGFRGFTLSLVVPQPGNASALIDAAVAAGARTLKGADSGPASREVDQVVLLLGVRDVGATKKFYVEHGLKVAKSFGTGSHRIAINSDAGPFTDLDGFAWERVTPPR